MNETVTVAEVVIRSVRKLHRLCQIIKDLIQVPKDQRVGKFIHIHRMVMSLERIGIIHQDWTISWQREHSGKIIQVRFNNGKLKEQNSTDYII